MRKKHYSSAAERRLTTALAARTSGSLGTSLLCSDAAGTADDGLGYSLSQNLLAAHHFGDRGASLRHQDLPAADGHLLHRRLQSGADGDAHHLEPSGAANQS